MSSNNEIFVNQLKFVKNALHCNQYPKNVIDGTIENIKYKNYSKDIESL